ncbi:MAG: OmpA family protein [Treponema sp.]|jgi:outer membrane protein OmpA-like peptidoglycan-associated protein|nr:OmpA family protein [Treponema sp.]
MIGKYSTAAASTGSGQKRFSFLLFLCCFFAAPCYTDVPQSGPQSGPQREASPWYEPFFIEGAALQYTAPLMFEEMIEPKPGFRAALGYEYRSFRFAAESGYTRIRGTNPFVLDLLFFPLALKLGYSLELYKGLGLQADLSFGAMFSKTAHYQDAIDLILENETLSPGSSPEAGARLYATWAIPRSFIKLYAGGGADAVFEPAGVILLPAFEAGISVKPFAMSRPKTTPEVLSEKAEFVEMPEEEVNKAEYPQEEAAGPVKTSLFRTAVYFRPDSTAFTEESLPVLDEAGRRLRAGPGLRVALRGYAAPSGTGEGQTALSAARSWRCAEYLMRNYGIAEERMNIEFYGADETPIQEAWEYRRRVDLIIEQIAANEE